MTSSDIGARFADAVDCQTGCAEVLDDGGRLLETQWDLGDVAQICRRVALALADDHVTELILTFETAQGAYHVAAFAFPDVARRHVSVLFTQRVANVEDRQAPRGKLLGIDDDLHLFFTAAAHICIGDAGNPFEPRLDEILREILQLGDLEMSSPAAVARSAPQSPDAH